MSFNFKYIRIERILDIVSCSDFKNIVHNRSVKLSLNSWNMALAQRVIYFAYILWNQSIESSVGSVRFDIYRAITRFDSTDSGSTD